MNLCTRVTQTFCMRKLLSIQTTISSSLHFKTLNIRKLLNGVSAGPIQEYSTSYVKPFSRSEVKDTSLSSSVYLCRHKSSKRRKRGKDEIESDDDDEESDEEDWELESGPDFKDVKVRVQSLRMDAILKAGLKMSRHKVEESFYGNKIRINKKRATKKSVMLYEGDVVDVINEAKSEMGEKELSRLMLKKIGDYESDTDRIPIVLRKYSNISEDY